MMAYEAAESAQDNFGKFIYQFQPETKTLIRKLERILNELYRQNVSLLFNETCLNERLLPNHTHTHTHIYIYIYIYIYLFVRVVGCYNSLMFDWLKRVDKEESMNILKVSSQRQ